MLFYVHSTPLAGEDYILDNKTVNDKLMEVLLGNLEMEKEIQQFAPPKNRQGAVRFPRSSREEEKRGGSVLRDVLK